MQSVFAGRAFGHLCPDPIARLAALREAFEPFILCIPKAAEIVPLNDRLSEEELKRFPLFAALALPRA